MENRKNPSKHELKGRSPGECRDGPSHNTEKIQVLANKTEGEVRTWREPNRAKGRNVVVKEVVARNNGTSFFFFKASCFDGRV